jgi:hypothetical protein
MPPIQATKIYSWEEARKIASPYGFAVVPPSPNALGQRDPNIAVIHVADRQGTKLHFSLVRLLFHEPTRLIRSIERGRAQGEKTLCPPAHLQESY